MINFELLNKQRESIKERNNKHAHERSKWIRKHPYFYKQLIHYLNTIIDENSKVLHVRSGTGFILSKLRTKKGVGVDDSEKFIEHAANEYKDLKFVCNDVEDVKVEDKFDYVLITSTEDIVDLKAVLDSVKKNCLPHTRVVVVYYNYLWQPTVRLAEKMGWRYRMEKHNWFGFNDVKNLLTLADYDFVANKRVILSPYNMWFISYFMNRFLARLPFFRLFTLMNITVARANFAPEKEASVSIVIPCRNEAGNVEDAVNRIPKLGSHTEIIFCDDKSTDGTANVVREMIAKHPDKDIKLYEGPAISKSENVWVGFDKAQCDILMILDADLTVIPEELPYFYEAIVKRKGEFINGSRLVYPMHKNAMRFFNVVGNKFFSVLFSYILDTQVKDTLCGTKVVWRKDYARIKKLRGSWGMRDRWGDYELLFSASKLNLKIIDLPVHYNERVYGDTKMTGRFKNGVIMLKICIGALRKLKFN